jgi:hypothetical protein
VGLRKQHPFETELVSSHGPFLQILFRRSVTRSVAIDAIDI